MSSITINCTEIVKAEADEVWRVLSGEFGEISHWASGVAESSAKTGTEAGVADAPFAGRVCQIPGLGAADETIVVYDPNSKKLAYTLTAAKLPSFIKNVRNEWSVADQGEGQVTVNIRSTTDASGIVGALAAPIMRFRLRLGMKQLLEDFRVYAETGEVSPAKLKAVAKTQE